jgi:uroporphyrinogen III methyltransferase/synthase
VLSPSARFFKDENIKNTITQSKRLRIKVKKVKLAAFRPENLLTRTAELAAKHGFDFFGFPLFELVKREEALEELEAVFKDGLDILVFTSVNGVRRSFELCAGKLDLKQSMVDSKADLCAIGPVTREELVKKGLHVHLMPTAYSTDGLKELFSTRGVKNTRIVFLRSSAGNKEITDYLRQAEAIVTDIVVYELKKKAIEDLTGYFVDLVNYKPDHIIFTSSMTFEIFFEFANELHLIEKLFEYAKIDAIGDLTAETIANKGLQVNFVAEKSTVEDLLQGLQIQLESAL